MLRARVKPAAADRFREEVKARGLTESDALRQAMAMWMAAPYAKNRSNQCTTDR